jgi:predicted TIM-barrel fold metal-dependent hydrolase
MTDTDAAPPAETAASAGFTAIDAWVNPLWRVPTNDKLRVDHLFDTAAPRPENAGSPQRLVEEMEANGIEKAVLCSGFSGTNDREWVSKAVAQFPEHFAGSHMVDPRDGMAAVRLVESLVNNDGYRLIRILGLTTQLPYNHAANYAVYAKCVELGVPVGLNVGLPGPRVPGIHQHPMPIDDVCAFFPDLTVILSHGGVPWTEICVALMVKWPNLYYMSSAFAPKYIPPAVFDYLNSRGAEKVMWASDYPLISFERSMREIAALPFRDETRRRNFMSETARRLFFPG